MKIVRTEHCTQTALTDYDNSCSFRALHERRHFILQNIYIDISAIALLSLARTHEIQTEKYCIRKKSQWQPNHSQQQQRITVKLPHIECVWVNHIRQHNVGLA